jgi:hypothetical protein
MKKEKSMTIEKNELPTLTYLAEKVTKPEELKGLIMNPGSRVRAFDHLKKSPGEVFPENTKAGEFTRNTKKHLSTISPPYDKERITQIFDMLKAFDSDIESDKSFTDVIEKSNNMINVMSIEDVTKAIEEMHVDIPPAEEAKRLLLRNSVKSDLLSAYRFKCLSSSDYYDTAGMNGRQKDFLQLLNRKYRDLTDETGDKFQIGLNDLTDRAKKELSDRVISGIVITTENKIQTLENIAKDLAGNKNFDYLGKEVALATISKALDNEKFNTLLPGEKAALLDKVNKCFELKLTFDAAVIDTSVDIKSIMEKIKDSEDYKSFTDKTIADNILLDHMNTLPAGDFRVNLNVEFSKYALSNFIDSTLQSTAKPIKDIIDDIRGHKAFLALGDDAGAEILSIKINGLTDKIRKNELQEDIYRRFDVSVNKILTDKNSENSKKIDRIRDDKYYPLLDQKAANDRVYQKIIGHDELSKTDKGALLTAFNQQAGTQYEMPKSGLEKFKSNVKAFFIEVGKKVGNVAKQINDQVKAIIGVKPTVSEPTFVSSSNKQDLVSLDRARMFVTNDGQTRSNVEVYIALESKFKLLNREIRNPSLTSTGNDFSPKAKKLHEQLTTFKSKIDDDFKTNTINEQEHKCLSKALDQLDKKVTHSEEIQQQRRHYEAVLPSPTLKEIQTLKPIDIKTVEKDIDPQQKEGRRFGK